MVCVLAYIQKSPIKVHASVYIGARVLVLVLSCFFANTTSDGTGESAHLHRLN